MSDAIISVEGLGKKYRLGAGRSNERYTALRDVIATKALSVFRNPKPALRNNSEANASEFWALKGVSFEVKQGEVVGIIGRNGAGKSTLLKILSRITEPTEGRVTLRGRVASLLEVGTGFHPELTGRENIYLNGAILGMHRAEIRKKFDEIVAFAETEKFLDTPVKRYSSGMYVRLAFAVAAHLEPEILIVDEVLAVGDVEFQKKCLGKMESVAKREGRTVIFVSHNMAAISSLASKAILLKEGALSFKGTTAEAIQRYLSSSRMATRSRDFGRGRHTRILAVETLSENREPLSELIPPGQLLIRVEVETDGLPGLSLELFLRDESGRNVGIASTHQFHGVSLPTTSGTYSCDLMLEPGWLASGEYSLTAATSVVNSTWDHTVEEAAAFRVPFSNSGGLSWDFKQSLGFGSFALPFSRVPVFRSSVPVTE